MNYLGEYNINQRLRAFNNISNFKKNLLYKKFDDEEVLALRKMQFNEQKKEAMMDENGYRTINPDDLVIETSIIPVHNDKYINTMAYTMQREAVEQENMQNTETKPFYLKIDPRDKIKLMTEINNLLTGYQKIFLTKSYKLFVEYVTDFVKSFNQFSMIYQSYHDKISQDVVFKNEFEMKLIQLENFLNKVITITKYSTLFTDENKKFNKKIEDVIKDYETSTGAVLGDAERAKIVKEREKELFGVEVSGLETFKGKDSGFVHSAYSKEYLIQLIKDCLKILKEMIDGKGIHAYITTKPTDLFERNIERGTVDVQPSFTDDESKAFIEHETGVLNDRMGDIAMATKSAEERAKYEAERQIGRAHV